MPENWPTDREYPLSSGWGWRWGTLHDGLDVACPEGTPIYSVHAGTVYVRSWDEGGYGWWVEVVGDDGYTTQYGHLSNNKVVPNGSWQPAGTVIAYSGNTGGSTGPHLHLRLKRTGALQGFDPLPELQGKPYAGQPVPTVERDGDLAYTDAGTVYAWAKAQGLSDAGAAGVMGNVQQESNFWWDAVEGRGQVGHIPAGVWAGAGALMLYEDASFIYAVLAWCWSFASAGAWLVEHDDLRGRSEG